MNTSPVAADIEKGQIALMVAVLSILLTAPIGAIGINMLASKLLKPTEKAGPTPIETA